MRLRLVVIGDGRERAVFPTSAKKLQKQQQNQRGTT